MKFKFTARLKDLFKSIWNKFLDLINGHNKTLKQIFLSRRSTFVFVFVFVFYSIPNFISVNKYKSYIERRINEVFNIKSKVAGNVSYLILPRPVILLRNVELRVGGLDDSEVVVKIPNLFMYIKIFSFFDERLAFSKIVLSDPEVNYDIIKRIKNENIDNILNNKLISKIVVKNGKLFLSDVKDPIRNINISANISDRNKIKFDGYFKYLDAKIDNLVFKISYQDKENYNIVGDADYKDGLSKFSSDFVFNVKDNETTIYSKMDLMSKDLSKLIYKYFRNIELPKTKFFNKNFKSSFSIQNNKNAILVNNGIFEGDRITGSFKGILPFILDDNGISSSIDKDKIEFDIDLKSFNANSFVKTKYNIFETPIEFIQSLKPIISLLKHAKFNIKAKNITFKKNMVNDFSLSISPILFDNVFNGLSIHNLFYISMNKNISASGKILNILNDDISMDMKVKTNIQQNIKNVFNGILPVMSFDGKLNITKSTFNIENANMKVRNNDINTTLTYKKDKEKDNYSLVIKSDKLDLDSFINEKLDLSYIISKLSKLSNTDLDFVFMVKALKMNKKLYNLFKLNTSFVDGDLSIKNFKYNLDGYETFMNGDLKNLLSLKAEFENFNYSISSKNLHGVMIPFIKNSFLEKIIANGVEKIFITLNGVPSDPDTLVDVSTNNIKVNLKGHLSDENSAYSINFQHNDLKGFLFSSGYINNNLLNYFYDNIPFSVTADIFGNNMNNVKLNIKKNILNGDIIKMSKNKNTEISVRLYSDNFDIKDVIKRLKNTDAYVDLMLKIVRNLPFNLYFNIKNAIEYNGNTYKDIVFDLKNSVNPGSFKFNINKNKCSVNLDTELINSNVFEGKLKVSGYDLPKDLLKNDVLSLKNGIADLNLDFKTNGDTSFLLFSNLSGVYNLDILKGTLVGISNYPTIFTALMELPNITTNSIIYTLENSFKSGIVNFDKITINGDLETAHIKNSVLKLDIPNINITGVLTGNLIQKSLDIDSIFNFAALSSDILVIPYKISGFLNELNAKTDLSRLVSKVNPVYLQKKKKDLLLSGKH